MNDYQCIQREWNERISFNKLQEKSWRYMALLSSLMSVFLLASLLAVWFLRPMKVYVAEVTKEGQVINVLPLKKTYQPKIAEKNYFLRNFIQLLRSLPLDPVVAKCNWISAYRFLNRRSATMMTDYLRKENPTSLLGKETKTIEIVKVDSMSNNSFEVHWIEHHFDLNGRNFLRKNFIGDFVIAINAPTNEDQILHNPLGIYIVDFNIATL